MYKVVIVEDEEMILKGLVYSIPWADIGCTVVGQGRNGVEGMEQIRLHRPDIVIVDINMPILSGTDMLRQTHADYCYSAIILSGYSSFEYAKDAMAYGAIRYLLKPLRREELFEAVEEAKERLSAEQAAREESARAETEKRASEQAARTAAGKKIEEP